MPPTTARTRQDRCPGVLRPWPADDGALVRLRLVGGRLRATSLQALAEVARTFGDGRIHLTGRANLQLRALPWDSDGAGLPEEVVAAVEATGLLPSRTHELGRNVMVSPYTGLDGGLDDARPGGRADLRPVAADLDERLLAEPLLADLPGRFLFVLDDGRGDLVGRRTDLGLVALDDRVVQLRVGEGWGPVVPLEEAAGHLVGLADRFVRVRGEGPDAAWHVEELATPPVPAEVADGRVPAATPAAAYGVHPGGEHVAVPDGVLDDALVDRLVARGPELVVTPWHGVVVPVR